MDRRPLTWDALIGRLDDEGIDKAVVLPLGASPESVQIASLFSPEPDVVSQITSALRHRDRVIPFANLDPRMGCRGNLESEQIADRPMTDFSPVLERFRDMGCVGIGEITANMALDDSRVINLFRQCGEFGMPVLFHCTGPGPGVYGLFDEAGAPRLEHLLREVPDTAIIGHAPGFWAELDGGVTAESKFTYPTGPVHGGGRLPHLLRTYPNLYADISAGSGYNAISRDKLFGARFLQDFQDRILFGTDVCFADAEGRMPHLGYLRSLLEEKLITPAVFEKITCTNALRILPLYTL